MSTSQTPFEHLIDRTLGGFPHREALRDELEDLLLWHPQPDDDARARAILDWARGSETFQLAVREAIGSLLRRHRLPGERADLASDILIGFMAKRLQQWSPLRGHRLYQYLVWETQDCIRIALAEGRRAPLNFSEVEGDDGEEFDPPDESNRDRPEAALDTWLADSVA